MGNVPRVVDVCVGHDERVFPAFKHFFHWSQAGIYLVYVVIFKELNSVFPISRLCQIYSFFRWV